MLLALLLAAPTLPAALVRPAAAACPCSDASLCEPLTLGKRPEVVAFEVPSDGHHGDGCNVYPSPNCTLNLTALTTLVDWGGPTVVMPAALYCDAHRHQVRVVRTTTNSWPAFLKSGGNRTAAALTEWARAQVSGLLSGGLPGRAGMRFDGVNIDWEHAVAANDTSSRETMAKAIATLRTEMDARSPAGSLAISYDAGWGAYGLPQTNETGKPPACVDGRCFDFAAMSAALSGPNDFFFVMDYSMESQIYAGVGGRCAAGADTSLSKVQLGMAQYLEAGVRTEQLVLGATWSSIMYPCLGSSLTGDCDITHLPFSNAPCSDLSGQVLIYNDVLALHRANLAAVVHYSEKDAIEVFDVPHTWECRGEQTPECRGTTGSGTRARVFWQTPKGLSAVYGWAREAGLRGVGVWLTNYAPKGRDAGNVSARHGFYEALSNGA